jgi:hypothetical protein
MTRLAIAASSLERVNLDFRILSPSDYPVDLTVLLLEAPEQPGPKKAGA